MKKLIVAALAAPAVGCQRSRLHPRLTGRQQSAGSTWPACLISTATTSAASSARWRRKASSRALPTELSARCRAPSVRNFQDRYGMKATGQIDNQALFALSKPDLAAH
jgi:hypothetical protein